MRLRTDSDYRAGSRHTMLTLYAIESEGALVRHMQEASLDPNHRGLDPDPLVGSEEWWTAVEDGTLHGATARGRVRRPVWSSMADYPTFELEADDGRVSSWTREGDIRRYAPGIDIAVSYVLHPYEEPDLMPDGPSRIVTRVEIADSEQRVSAIAPGPGGAGYGLAREEGNSVHYAIGEEAELSKLAESFEHSVVTRVGEWSIARIWFRDASGIAEQIELVRTRASAAGAAYDGGEIVEGKVWGPTAWEAHRTNIGTAFRVADILGRPPSIEVPPCETPCDPAGSASNATLPV